MEKLAALVVVVLLLVIGLALVFNAVADSTARSTNAQANLEYARGQAEATIIRAQASARLDSAQAMAMLSAAALPWGVLGILGLLGFGVVILALVVVTRPRPAPMIVERQIMFLPAPGARRAEVWQALSAGQGDMLMIPARSQEWSEVKR